MPRQVRSADGSERRRQPAGRGRAPAPTDRSRPGTRPTTTTRAKPPFSALDPEALRAYVDHGFADAARRHGPPEVPARDRVGGLPHGRRPRRASTTSARSAARSPSPSARSTASVPPPSPARSSTPSPTAAGRVPRPRPLRPARGPGAHRRQHPRAFGDGPLQRCHTPGVTSGPWPSELPSSLSPSKVSTFTDCALAFRFSSIDRLPEPPSAPATKGTLVHAALERLFCLPADERTLPAALTAPRPGHRRPPRPTPSSPSSRSTTQAEAAFLDDAEQPGPPLLRARGPDHHHAHRPRAQARGLDRRSPPAGHHRPARARRRRRAGRHRLQDGPGPPPELRAGQARRRPLLRLPLRAALRAAPGQGPAALPGRAGRHHHHADRAVDPGPRAQGHRHLDGGRAGLLGRRLPPQAVAAVRLVRLPGLLPGVRRRPRRRPGQPRRSRSIS